MADSCYTYHATQNNLTTFFCDCYLYNNSGRCVPISTATSSTTSFGLTAIVSLVAGVGNLWAI